MYRYTDDEIKRLKDMGALIKKGKNEYNIKEPRGVYCPQCKKKIELNKKNGDLSLYHCFDCGVNWMNPEICTDDTDEYIYCIVQLALKGRLYF